jgi:uncharacterized membrane protein (UPF0127 family)
MKIINAKNQAILADNLIFARGIFVRMKGLLGRRHLPKGAALLIKRCNSVHTFFMRFPIDVLFVGKDNRVVKAISRLRPFRISAVCWRSSFVIELPAGTIQATATSPNDQLLFSR